LKKNDPLHISIPEPCSQDWAAMPAKLQGRYCESCSNIVYDFSQMSDAELFEYFEKNPSTHCGRFRSTQLDREILPPRPKNIFTRRINYAATALMAVLSLKGTLTNALSKTERTGSHMSINPQPKRNILPGNFIISGIVCDEDGKPMEHVQVTIDGQAWKLTDKAGFYSFEINTDLPMIHRLNFFLDGYYAEGRLYEPTVQVTRFDVTLRRNHNQMTGGIICIVKPYTRPITFKSHSASLTRQHKSDLSKIVETLKDHPDYRIVMTGSAISLQQQKLVHLRINAIRDYIEARGIDGSRFKEEIDSSKNTEIITLTMKNY